MFTILHLSDLHRSAKEPFNNDEIVSSLKADIGRYHAESPAIPAPDAIIVSGDLVQGLPLRSSKYPADLIAQYNVAVELLERLTDTFLDGDRTKLIIVPGNHDVDFNASLAGMSEVPVKKRRDISGLLHDDKIPDNPHRWSWKEGKLYKISDFVAYEDRFKYYRDAFRQFYENVTLAYPIDPSEYCNLFELNGGRIVVAAFNSCHQNDCFNYVGDIPRSEIAKAHLKIESTGKKYELRMAVWHHDVVGPPKRSDYMDGTAVKLLIDKGFRLGLHGHQHKAQTVRDFVHTSRRASMAVVSAGSLGCNRTSARLRM